MTVINEQTHAFYQQANMYFLNLPPELKNAPLSILTVDLGRNNAISAKYIEQALESQDFDSVPEQYPIGARILAETARLMGSASLSTPAQFPISFNRERVSNWSEGIFKLTLSWQKEAWKKNGKIVKWDHKVASARLYELGISGDQYGHLVIRGVQKHRLNLVYRQTQNAQNVGLLEEKRAGENIWKYIKKHSGRKPELFGFLTAALIFGPHARDGKIVFPTPDFQPEIRSRANEINALKKSSGDYLDDHAKDEIKKREDTIAMIRKRTDFAGMLGSLGVPVAEGSREGYMTTTLNDILKGIERSWLDDTGATVYPLRTILNKLYTMQMQ